MKKIFLFAIFAAFFACNKSASLYQNTRLRGKWQLTEYYISPGNGGSWYPADTPTQHTIEFRNDNSFISSDSAYQNAIGFNIIDSNRLEFILPTQIPSTHECYYQIQDNGTTLIISPVSCIEGCSNKYKAINGNGSIKNTDQ
ncbi:hypothetical protein FRZ67_08430 [Panacibacter ginsenosidivorans]|uniref:Lipocalin-like domain-containing protein n=1 Tax=Panacibacter ginsenosidivorans TaxID=1813871 RepID=A0A5B8V742_9BACT|nr:hypothetical protein [Panacibacter ginsenosidivorans]QEC67320.1 hypothetical protein FRZ67_08430 [Panacibacter ginsenosidivorans]